MNLRLFLLSSHFQFQHLLLFFFLTDHKIKTLYSPFACAKKLNAEKWHSTSNFLDHDQTISVRHYPFKGFQNFPMNIPVCCISWEFPTWGEGGGGKGALNQEMALFNIMLSVQTVTFITRKELWTIQHI